MPVDRVIEAAPGLLHDGYEFIDKRCRELGSDVFRTRLMLQKTICLQGEAAARLFYDERHFCRATAAPRRLKKTLLGMGGVQALDDLQHRHRKAMFVEMVTPEAVDRVAEISGREWQAAAKRWQPGRSVVLLDAAAEVLFRSITEWCGLPLDAAERSRRLADTVAVIDGSGGFGPRHWRGRRARSRADAWMQETIEQVRAGTLHAAATSPIAKVAAFRDLDGRLLDSRTAGVELFNVVRPTVAVNRFIVFAALALHRNPECVRGIRRGGDEYLHQFVQEVRRFYPFFPFAAARVRKAFVWRGYRFPQGTRVLLDLYGTDHDPRLWDEPEKFRPERFAGWSGGVFRFIPQGGGSALRHHRCPGEAITIALMKRATRFLTEEVAFTLPVQDLSVHLNRMPAQPESGFVIVPLARVESVNG